MKKFNGGFVLTMQYNEYLLLPYWIKHYEKYFEHTNIYVIDHGSDRNIVPDGMNRIFVPRSAHFSETDRRDCVQGIVFALMQYYDFGVFCDADELIVLDEFNPSLMGDNTIYYMYGFDLFKFIHNGEGKIYGILNEGQSKPLVFNYPLPQWSPGFHGCILKTPPNLKFILGHTKYIDKKVFTDGLAIRKHVYNSMSGHDKSVGIANHWNSTEAVYDELYEKVAIAISHGAVHNTLPDLTQKLTVNQAGFSFFEHGAPSYVMELTSMFPELV